MQVQSPIWEAEGAEKREAVQRMFSEIAPTYDRINSVMSLSLHRRWRACAVRSLNLQPGATALDVCCGTGDFMVELRKAVGVNGRVLGMDFCPQMLKVAVQKDAGAVGIGDACALPVQSGSLDAVTVGWGIRNVADIDLAHCEIARVLRPGGKFVSLDMALPRHALVRSISLAICGTALPLMGKLFKSAGAYTYLPKSTQRFKTRDELTESMRRAGFGEIRYRDFFFGNICLHTGTKL